MAWLGTALCKINCVRVFWVGQNFIYPLIKHSVYFSLYEICRQSFTFDLYYMDCNIYLDQSVQKFDLLFNTPIDEQGATAVYLYIYCEVYTKFNATYSIQSVIERFIDKSMSLLYFMCIFIWHTRWIWMYVHDTNCPF